MHLAIRKDGKVKVWGCGRDENLYDLDTPAIRSTAVVQLHQIKIMLLLQTIVATGGYLSYKNVWWMVERHPGFVAEHQPQTAQLTNADYKSMRVDITTIADCNAATVN